MQLSEHGDNELLKATAAGPGNWICFDGACLGRLSCCQQSFYLAMQQLVALELQL